MDTNLPQATQQLAEHMLMWVGYGTLVGLLAKAIMPGRDPGGAIATLAMGIGGSVLGSGILAYFWEGHRVSPISPAGFLIGTTGAFVLLGFYRLLAGYYFTEGQTRRTTYATRRRVRSPRQEVIIDE